MTERTKIKEAFKTIIEMCGKISCRQCPMSYCDGDGDYLCNFERRPPHACELREVKVYEPHWEEFDVTDGYFTSKELEADYPYYDCIKFLNESKKHNAFGGWYYPNEGWSMFLWVVDENNNTHSLYGINNNVKPISPSKIRFWRFKE